MKHGEVEIVVGADRRVVHAAQALVVPAAVEQSASAGQRCRAIVVDFPVRAKVGGVDIR
ncbi:MAG: hypothetical protein ACREEC_13765 [Thermoplasmata archaeon]